LSPVGSLVCGVPSNCCCIFCAWSPPFSLTLILNYLVEVAQAGELNSVTTYYTNWTYCPSNFGIYNVSIAGNNTVGIGESINEIVIFTEGTVHLLYEYLGAKELGLTALLRKFRFNH
jgi:hypothetical protein